MAPRLSVIVPIYNVERYLPACLDSLASQTLREIEVLMVDDGSPDGSAAIAAEYAARDSRFTLIRKENGGLGAARNTGISHISPDAEFLTFVDSDDIIPPDAYRLMTASLDESGSDFATGNVFHLKGEKSWQVPLLKMLAGEARKRTHISKNPKLVADRIACNKVFRRTFWEKHGFAFPEGILHEDIPVVLPAHYRAEAVDIIGEPTYFWRLREGESAPSITQRRREPQAIRDRVTAVSLVSDFLSQQQGPEFAEYKRQYDDRVLRDDLRLFLRVLPDATAEFHEAFLEAANRYLDTIDPQIVMALPADLRVQWLLVRKHAMPELIALLASQRRKEPVEVSGGFRKYASFAPLESSSVELPKAALRIDRDLDLRAPLRSVEWRNGQAGAVRRRLDRQDRHVDEAQQHQGRPAQAGQLAAPAVPAREERPPSRGHHQLRPEALQLRLGRLGARTRPRQVPQGRRLAGGSVARRHQRLLLGPGAAQRCVGARRVGGQLPALPVARQGLPAAAQRRAQRAQAPHREGPRPRHRPPAGRRPAGDPG